MAMAAEISGFVGVKFKTVSRIRAKPAKVAITAPYPTSDAVLNKGNMQPKTPWLILSFKFSQRPRRMATKVAHATTKAIINDHRPAMFFGFNSGYRSVIGLKSVLGKIK